MQCVNLLLTSGWGLVKLSFLSYFYASYYNIEVPHKILPPCQRDCASFLAVFFKKVVDNVDVAHKTCSIWFGLQFLIICDVLQQKVP